MGLAGAASLTMVVAGQRSPGYKLIEKLCAFFSFTERERLYFLDLIRINRLNQRTGSTSLPKGKGGRNKNREMETMPSDVFRLISDPIYFLLRELTRLKDFSTSSNFIASRLRQKVSSNEIHQAYETLERLKLVKKRGPTYTYSDNDITTTDDNPSEAIKKFHQRISYLAKDAIQQVDVTKREFGATIFPIRQSDLESAKHFIRQFEREFMERFETNEADSVYCFNLQLFPMTE